MIIPRVDGKSQIAGFPRPIERSANRTPQDCMARRQIFSASVAAHGVPQRAQLSCCRWALESARPQDGQARKPAAFTLRRSSRSRMLRKISARQPTPTITMKHQKILRPLPQQSGMRSPIRASWKMRIGLAMRRRAGGSANRSGHTAGHYPPPPPAPARTARGNLPHGRSTAEPGDVRPARPACRLPWGGRRNPASDARGSRRACSGGACHASSAASSAARRRPRRAPRGRRPAPA
jgi:hypothetical protein